MGLTYRKNGAGIHFVLNVIARGIWNFQIVLFYLFHLFKIFCIPTATILFYGQIKHNVKIY